MRNCPLFILGVEQMVQAFKLGVLFVSFYTSLGAELPENPEPPTLAKWNICHYFAISRGRIRIINYNFHISKKFLEYLMNTLTTESNKGGNIEPQRCKDTMVVTEGPVSYFGQSRLYHSLRFKPNLHLAT